MENWLTKRVLLSPKQTAVVFEGQERTFQELEQDVQKWAKHLAGLEHLPKRVAVLTENNLTGYEIILALQQLGCTLVLLNSRLASDELQFQLDDAEIQLCLVSDELGAQYQLKVEQQLTFTDLRQIKAARAQIISDFAEDQVTTIMYTSGTTGRPKGVQQTFKNHFYSAVGSALNLGLGTDDNWLCAVPIFHISGFSIMMRGLIYGMTVTLFDQFNAGKVAQALVQQPVTTMSVVPYMLKQLLALQPVVPYNSHFRCLLLGGGPIDRETLEVCQQRQIPVIQSYGMTETASQVVALSFKDAPRKIGSAGKPLFPVSVRIQGASQPGQVGEIYLQSPTLTPGYLKRPAKNKQLLAASWFKTGDLGYLDAEGFLFVKGREGDMISSGGENIFPNEVEAAYVNFPELSQIVVVGVADEKWGARPVAFVAGTRLTATALREYGRAHLAHYKVPVAFYQVEDFPRTASGKIQRRRLLNARYQQNKL
ncbi:o-succinylbenzoate--CoA ligase [Loigolactobacillus backii]|uniref:o-succinylbenzoate--CoA ligase n=1 Tax=Loigolactobacillus backii TaxID=375175 RepID=UPI0022FD7241|nr:o-succinylbenzoate--CoA ligase [Loigolactobacillus backii]MDA5386738.1 o-succinylbenzoate--CoA ligase [Loigolactobacillus backii]MDA5389263.1 o-succinylbenzoate--CoA ligase [Loigolactobacillus backii]